jgi:hypothetical protein
VPSEPLIAEQPAGDLGTEADRPVRQAGPPLGPALIVIGIAAAIVILGSIVALLGSSSAHAPVSQLGSKVPGVEVRAVPASAFIGHIAAGGEPPADVVKQLSVPASSQYLGATAPDAGVDQFDRGVKFSSPDTSGEVADFYRVELAAGHWQLQFAGKVGHNQELIGQKNGSDGYQWRVAIVVTTVNPRLAPALAGSNQTSTSSTVMTLYQVADAS